MLSVADTKIFLSLVFAREAGKNERQNFFCTKNER